MCTPIGHTLLGLTVAQGWVKEKVWKNVILLMVIIFAANAPDFDYIPGIITGNPNQYHRLWTHSISFVLIVSAMSAFIAWIGRWANPFWIGGLVFSILMSHLLLDYFNVDRRPPIGIPLFWPLSRSYFQAPFLIFPEVVKSSQNSSFFKTLFVAHNLRTLLFEFFVLTPLFGIVLFFRCRRKIR